VRSLIPGPEAHTYRKTARGAEVFILETGAVIGPEEQAMLQALHSRSTGGFLEHLKKLVVKGAKKFMGTFYVGYNHKSIGDCGTVTIFIEHVSMLVAKAFQDSPLYSGQESSTRFLDFAHQPFLNIADIAAGECVLETWRTFYLGLQDPVREYLRLRHPRNEGEDEVTWEKAITARAFDITRAFLPAGATTNLAWHTNLRQAADKLALLRHHPLVEVRQVTEAVEGALKERFPNSFGHRRYEKTEAYNAWWMQNEYYYHDADCPSFAVTGNDIQLSDLGAQRQLLESRPQKTELPRFMDELGRIQFTFTLDFGSFRDIQRHRAVTQRMPLLTEDLGFHPWYLEELPDTQRDEARELLEVQQRRIDTLGLPREYRQYYLPMGYLTSNRLTGALPQLVYLIELRATRFVHPTLRMRAEQMASTLTQLFGESGLKLHLDPDPGRFDVRRGAQDIVER
jgi:thymidylate synthase ThyX